MNSLDMAVLYVRTYATKHDIYNVSSIYCEVKLTYHIRCQGKRSLSSYSVRQL